MIDDKAIDDGLKAKKNSMSDEDKEVASEMKELEKLTGDSVNKEDE